MSEPEMSSTTKPHASFSFCRVFLMVFVAACVGVIATLGAWIWNGEFSKSVTATGRITLNGEPVTVGVVMAQHSDHPHLTPMGVMDAEGRFELMTNMQPGVQVGQYKVRVASFTNGMPPIPLVPQVYTEFASSPLTVEVTNDESNNFFELKLEGNVPTPATRPAATNPDTPDMAGDEKEDNPASESLKVTTE